MDSLVEQFRRLDQNPPPQQWEEIKSRASGVPTRTSEGQTPITPTPSARQRALIGAVVLLIVAAAGLFLWKAFEGAGKTVPLGAGGQGSLLVTVEVGQNGFGSDIYAADPVTQNASPILAGDERDVGGSFSPDGTKIAFARTDGTIEQQDMNIYVMDVDGSNLQRLTGGPGVQRGGETQPEWSPDGTSIVYGNNSELRLLSADGSDDRLLTSGLLIQSPAWSPDGTKVVFVAFPPERNNNSEIYVVDVSSGDVTQLTHNRVSDGYPAWSPDGRTIVISRSYDVAGSEPPSRTDWDLYSMDADGSSQVQLTSTHQDDDTGPVWSPDGSRIAFTRSGLGQDQPGAVYVMDNDGSNVTRVYQPPQGGSSYVTDWGEPVGAPSTSEPTPTEAAAAAKYVFSDVSVHAGYQRNAVSPVEPSKATVRYRYSWSGREYPGEHDCTAVVLDSEGKEIGRLPFGVSSLTPGPTSTFEMGVPVSGDPREARLSCDPQRTDTPVAYQISDVRVSGPVVRTNGETAVELHYTVGWPVQLPEYPSENACTATLTGPDGSTLSSLSYTAGLPAGPADPIYLEARRWPDPSLAQRPDQLSGSVDCHPYSRSDVST